MMIVNTTTHLIRKVWMTTMTVTLQTALWFKIIMDQSPQQLITTTDPPLWYFMTLMDTFTQRSPRQTAPPTHTPPITLPLTPRAAHMPTTELLPRHHTPLPHPQRLQAAHPPTLLPRLHPLQAAQLPTRPAQAQRTHPPTQPAQVRLTHLPTRPAQARLTHLLTRHQVRAVHPHTRPAQG